MSTLYGKFDKDSVLAAVDESNKRFDTYTEEQRKQFREEARSHRETIGAPQWLIDRMEALKKLPPPTLEQVRAQWEASERQMDPEHFKVRRDRKTKVIR